MAFEEDVEKLKKDKISSFFFDMAKLSFASIVAVAIISITSDKYDPLATYKAIVGAVLTLIFARIGFITLKK